MSAFTHSVVSVTSKPQDTEAVFLKKYVCANKTKQIRFTIPPAFR